MKALLLVARLALLLAIPTTIIVAWVFPRMIGHEASSHETIFFAFVAAILYGIADRVTHG